MIVGGRAPRVRACVSHMAFSQQMSQVTGRRLDARCRAVYQDCTTGIGDKLLDAISGAAMSRVCGCRRPVVVMRMTPRARQYRMERILSTAFDIRVDRTFWGALDSVLVELHNLTGNSDDANIPDSWLMLQKPCGVHKPSWLMNYMRDTICAPMLKLSMLHHELRRMAQSVRIRHCDTLLATIPDIGQRIGIHLRRRDKLRFASRHDFRQLYASIPIWLRKAGHRHVYLASDDRLFLSRFASSLARWGIDAAFAPANTSELDDLCALAHTSLVLQGSMQSQFSALAAIIGSGRIVIFNGTSAQLIDRFLGGWVEARALNIEVAPLVAPPENTAL